MFKLLKKLFSKKGKKRQLNEDSCCKSRGMPKKDTCIDSRKSLNDNLVASLESSCCKK